MQQVFFILIALLVSSCAYHSSAPVRDSSVQARTYGLTHRVVPGDTLYSIAWRYGLKYEELARINGISAPYVIKPSQLLRLSNAPVATASTSAKPATPKANTTAVKPVANQNTRSVNKTPVANKPPVLQTKASALVWQWPSAGVLIATYQGSEGLNKGIDLAGKLGEPVQAAASGQVVYAGSGLRGYGKLLIIKHNDTFLSAYAHCNRLLVEEGAWVKAGQRIADMGASGTDRVKLHFEIRREGVPVNPLQYLPRR